MNNILIAKTAVRILASAGTGIIVGTVVKNNVTTTNIVSTIAVRTGAFALGGVAGDASAAYTDKLIDETVGVFKAIKKS